MCVCVYEIVMALINSQLQRQPADCVCVMQCAREEGGGAWGLSWKAIRPRVIKCLVNQKQPS